MPAVNQAYSQGANWERADQGRWLILFIILVAGSCLPRVRFQGDTRNGQKHGYGVFKAANGASYAGWWVDGKKHGKGTYVSASGESHEGWWKDNQPDPKSVLPIHPPHVLCFVTVHPPNCLDRRKIASCFIEPHKTRAQLAVCALQRRGMQQHCAD
jgi:hypothetical protein